MSFEVPPPRSRILTSVVGLLFLVGTIPLGLLGARLASFNRDRLEIQQKEQQLVIAEATAAEVGEFARAREAAIEGIARGLEPTFGRESPEAALELVKGTGLLNRYLADDPDVLMVVLAAPSAGDADGRRLGFVSASRVGEAELQRAEEILVGRSLEEGFAGRRALAIPPGEPPMLVVSVPIASGARVAGVLAALMRLGDLQERLEARSQRLYDIFVTDARGQRFLAHSHREGGLNLLSSDLVAAFRDGGDSRTMPFRAAADGREREWLGAFARVRTLGWGVFVATDAASAYYAVGKMRETTLVWSIASVLLALVLGALFAERLVHPIRELASGAVRLARGDFSRPIEVRKSNELGLLARTFNHMADEIGEQLAKLEAAARENKDLFFASIRMLAEAIDEKDPYTRGHSERVTRFAVATAKALGLPQGEVERIQIGALLHDVGKIGVDDRILRKPAALTEEEFAIMKQHPEKGAHIMGAVRQLADIVPGMRFHHEKVDGTGYPLGLKGDDIPLAAQIISVADTFDAMTTDRPYQKGMDPDFVIGKLQGWVGSRFRGDVVEAFARAFAAGQIEVRPKAAARAAVAPGSP